MQVPSLPANLRLQVQFEPPRDLLPPRLPPIPMPNLSEGPILEAEFQTAFDAAYRRTAL